MSMSFAYLGGESASGEGERGHGGDDGEEGKDSGEHCRIETWLK